MTGPTASENFSLATLRAAVKKVKMAAEKGQSTKVKNAATTRDNTKGILTIKGEKTTREKGRNK